MLPEPYRTQALDNYAAIATPHAKTKLALHFADALDYAFSWASTDQGHGYWSDLFDRLLAGDIQAEEPSAAVTYDF